MARNRELKKRKPDSTEADRLSFMLYVVVDVTFSS